MALHGASSSGSSFKLSESVQDIDLYRILIRMPKAEFLSEMRETLGLNLWDTIKKTIEHLYSPVAQRKPDEGADYFFHTVCSTALYEIVLDTKIKNADHVTKAANLLRMLEKSINELTTALSSGSLNGEQKKLIKQISQVFTLHQDLLIRALRLSSSTSKQSIKTHCNMDVDSIHPGMLSPNSKYQTVRNSYHVTPEKPQANKTTCRDKRTPKKLSPNDHDALNALLEPHPYVRRALDYTNQQVDNVDGYLSGDASDCDETKDWPIENPTGIHFQFTNHNRQGPNALNQRVDEDWLNELEDEEDWLNAYDAEQGRAVNNNPNDDLDDLAMEMDKKAGFSI